MAFLLANRGVTSAHAEPAANYMSQLVPETSPLVKRDVSEISKRRELLRRPTGERTKVLKLPQVRGP